MNMRVCSRCKKEKSYDDYYPDAKRPNTKRYCKQCCNNQTISRQRKIKKMCLDYKGGKCVNCNYDKCQAALDFHHVDPKQKEFNISKLRKFSIHELDQNIKDELDKCIVLCRNCHAEEHSRISSENKDITEDYLGKYSWQKGKPKCVDCKNEINYGTERCKSCWKQYRTNKFVSKLPDYESLTLMIKGSSLNKVAENLEISRKALKRFIQCNSPSCPTTTSSADGEIRTHDGLTPSA